MKRFIKSTGKDPYLIDPNDFNPGFFGHLNALVDAITALQQGGGGGTGNPISVYLNATEKVTVLSKLTFLGNVLVTEGALGEARVTIQGVAANSVSFDKIQQINTGTILGRYSSTSPGDVQAITLGSGFVLNPTTGLLTVSGTTTTVSQGTGISVTGAATTPTVALAALSPNPATASATLATISVDAYGRVTSASSGSISSVTLTAASTITTTPTNPNDIANKTYVDNFAQGLKPKASARLATTGPITLSTLRTIDGVLTAAGDRVLVKNQASAATNGVYIVAVGVWARATDYDSAAEAADGSFVFVRSGATNGSSGFVQITSVTNFGSDPITFAQFSSAGTYSNGLGLELLGTQFSVTETLTGATQPTAPGSFGSTTTIPQITVNSQGRITNVSNATPAIALGSMVTGILPVANGGTNFSTYDAGDILYASSTSALAKLAGGTANNNKVLTIVGGLPAWANAPTGFTNPMDGAGQLIYGGALGTPTKLPASTINNLVLTYDTTLNAPKWAAAGGSNPTTTRGDIIYTSVTGSPGTLDRLGIGTVGQYLRVVESPASSGIFLPKWANGITTGTVVSFVVDGYGGPIVATGLTVFKVIIPFTGIYTSLTIESDQPLVSPNTISLTASATGSITSIINTGSSRSDSGTINVTAGSTLLFTVTNSTNSPVTKLFVNLTGTRS